MFHACRERLRIVGTLVLLRPPILADFATKNAPNALAFVRFFLSNSTQTWHPRYGLWCKIRG